MPDAPATARRIVGWDLGGVHVKAALVEDGRVAAVVQTPCALWRGLEALDEALAALPGWAREPASHAVTMTGELCDCFADRREGVRELSAWAERRLAGRVRIYAGRGGFVAPEEAEPCALDVASANWHATAALAGRSVTNALVVDVGSTTADLIPVVGSRPAALGYSDAERLETGELVYTGAVRTPLMALCGRAPFQGRFVGLMAEHFATTADIHRLLGSLPVEADQQPAGDGRGKSVAETRTRLARMIGRDREEGDAAAWARLAAWFAEAQLRALHDAALGILSRGDLPANAPVVACGVGRFIAERLAARLGRPCLGWAEVVGAGADWASSCAPAVAVGLLADGE